MKNLFSIGTSNIKKEIISDKFSSREFFYKLLDLAPALKIKEWCNITSYEEFMGYKNNSGKDAEKGYDKFKQQVQTKCHTIHQLFLLAYKLCQNYDFFSYFYMSGHYMQPFLGSPKITPGYEIDRMYSINSRLQAQNQSKTNLLFIKEHLPLFKKELENFLLISSAYTFSMDSNTKSNLSNAILELSQDTISKQDSKQIASIFSVQKNSFLHDGLSLTSSSDYIGKYIYPDFFNLSETKKHVKLNSIYDLIILDGLTKKAHNPFFKLCRNSNYVKKISFDPYKAISNLTGNENPELFEKINKIIHKNTKKRLEGLELSSFSKFFAEESLIGKKSCQQSYDSQFITDYIFERIFNLNYIASLSKTWANPGIYEGHGDLSKKEIWDMFFKGILGFLFLYPLPKFRLSISEFLFPFLGGLAYPNPISTPAAQLLISPYLNGFFFQTFVYFPLIDIVFTYLLRLFNPSNDIIFEQLKNILSNTYQQTINKNSESTFIKKIISSPFSSSFDIKPEIDGQINFFIDFFCYLFTDEESFYLQELSAIRNYNFANLLYSCTSKGLFFNIECINRHIMNFYQLRNYETILFPFSSEFVYSTYISQLNGEGLEYTSD